MPSPSALPSLPIDAILADLIRVLANDTACVVHAPPGSGKTTRIPLALMDAPWLAGQKIIMLEPRRLAARAAARHMAGLLNDKVGQRIGYRTRLDMRVSAATQVEVVTEGILTRMLHHDPELSGYGCLIFDEFHERSLQADLGLSLSLEVREALRPDLRLVVMSATLDVDNIAGLLAPCPNLSCPGQTWPVDTRYLRLPDRFVEDRMARAIHHLLGTENGDILAFLPGAREIRRTAELLENVGPSTRVHPLFGALAATEQDQAIAPAPSGTRKVVLTTAIAETSLTIEGVHIVVDSGLSRLPRFDARSGMTRLVTEPASLATITQRCGRAGRTGPGICVRLWDKADEVSRKPFPLPEILEADLAPLVLDLAQWGTTDPGRMTWLTPPPEGNYAGARTLLQELGMLDSAGRITAHGQKAARLPLHPRISHMLLTAKAHGMGPTALRLAALLAEPGRIMRGSPDLRDALGPGATLSDTIRAGMEQIGRLAEIRPGRPDPDSIGLLTALAYPDRIARRQHDGSYRLTTGRKAIWPGPSSLAEHEYLAIADLDGEATGARIWHAAPLSRNDLDTYFGEAMTDREDVGFDPATGRVTALCRRMLWNLCLEERPGRADPEVMARTLLAAVTDLSRLPWTDSARGLRERVRFLHGLDPDAWPDVSDATLLATVHDWLLPFAPGARSLSDLARISVDEALKNLIGWNRMADLDRMAPTHMTVPSGASRRIDYAPESGPVLPVKLQEMFGCASTPTLADGRYTMVLHLLSPAGRPLQVTRDLESFWQNGYPLVRAEMRGRYPRHPWPEDPTTALPTAKTKKAMTPR